MPVGLTPAVPSLLDAGWGRAAVSRFAKAPEDIRAEVIKALEGKISVEFRDYSQWEREPVLQPDFSTPTKAPSRLARKHSSKRPITGASGTTSSSLQIHTRNKKTSDDSSTLNEEERRLSILRIVAEAKRKSIAQYETLCGDLKNQNHALREKINRISVTTHQNATNLLEKYAEYAGASKAIKRNHVTDHYQAETSLRLTSTQLLQELNYLEQELVALDMQLQDVNQDLQVLRTYKDKEYPIKEMQISRLTKSLDELSMKQKIERGGLDKITNDEGLKLHMNYRMKSQEILENAANKAFTSRVPMGVINMACHNASLRQEIEEHKQNGLEVEEAIRILQLEVETLIQMPESNLKLTLFPGIFLPNRRCRPDEDVILDIPSQKPLPI